MNIRNQICEHISWYDIIISSIIDIVTAKQYKKQYKYSYHKAKLK